jgi:hypothetical protein
LTTERLDTSPSAVRTPATPSPSARIAATSVDVRTSAPALAATVA